MTRSLLPPEIVQSSGMDCGPAALMSVLAGHAVQADYAGLRSACQTAVDGTSIDVLAVVARQLGLVAQQRVLSPDTLLEPAALALPAIAVTQLPDRRLHFLVVWRRVGSWVVLMDPAVGRRYVRARDLAAELYRHELSVPARALWLVATQPAPLAALRARLARTGVLDAEARVSRAHQARDLHALAGLEAASRMLLKLKQAGALPGDAARLLDGLERADAQADRAAYDLVPESFWSTRVSPGESDRARVSGAVVLTFTRPPTPRSSSAVSDQPVVLPRERRAAQPRPSTASTLWRYVRSDGSWRPALLASGVALSALSVAVEALLLRGLVDLGQQLGSLEQRAFALSSLLLFLLGVLLLEYPLARVTSSLGARLEARIRVAFQTSLGRLDAEYFATRAGTDLAARAHALHHLRSLPTVATRMLRSALELMMTCAGLIWLAPYSAPWTLAAAGLSLALPLACQLVLRERDARVREHDVALGRYYLDALLGLVAIRAHAGERAVRREHEALSAAWGGAARSLSRAALGVESVQGLFGAAFSIGLLLDCLAHGQSAGSMLLILYWGLHIPVLGQDLVAAARQYPGLRNIASRVLEPIDAASAAREVLGTAEARVDGTSGAATDASTSTSACAPRFGIALRFEGAELVLSGRQVLEPIDLEIASGEHVALVGGSGAGKSSLLSLVLGLARVTRGRILADGVPLDDGAPAALLARMAWVDPGCQLWNRSLIENLAYGAAADTMALPELLEAAELMELLESLPEGLQTALGESGALMSGGEGQRVRLARALARRSAELVLLDEPFRGLDRDRRQRLLARARAVWSRATLLCVTHDLEQSRLFDRVLVIERGRIAEEGRPAELAARGGRYTQLLAAHAGVDARVWNEPSFGRRSLDSGRVGELQLGGGE